MTGDERKIQGEREKVTAIVHEYDDGGWVRREAKEVGEILDVL